jgi:hypothetical protein
MTSLAFLSKDMDSDSATEWANPVTILANKDTSISTSSLNSTTFLSTHALDHHHTTICDIHGQPSTMMDNIGVDPDVARAVESALDEYESILAKLSMSDEPKSFTIFVDPVAVESPAATIGVARPPEGQRMDAGSATNRGRPVLRELDIDDLIKTGRQSNLMQPPPLPRRPRPARVSLLRSRSNGRTGMTGTATMVQLRSVHVEKDNCENIPPIQRAYKDV